MLEWTVACSMYLAIPVTKAFLSSKLVLKLGWKQEKEHQAEVGASVPRAARPTGAQHPPTW